jgi:biotin operon repressor
MAILDVLADGEWHKAKDVAAKIGVTTSTVQHQFADMRKRGFNIETDGGRTGKGARLRQFPRKSWLPVALIPDWWRMTHAHDYEPAEARRMIEDHIATEERRKAQAA